MRHNKLNDASSLLYLSVSTVIGPYSSLKGLFGPHLEAGHVVGSMPQWAGGNNITITLVHA